MDRSKAYCTKLKRKQLQQSNEIEQERLWSKIANDTPHKSKVYLKKAMIKAMVNIGQV